ncbi:unnamed protein product [Caenorhabditis auriculariae]|uniref:Uncharacterized protein n=1 Tax=Caenorhabditis auriculariae TaxID=2777116 RepID=A0A8S1GRP9_9PELO|nr:unnamed protein product [Caenorhabditis auriculariae]
MLNRWVPSSYHTGKAQGTAEGSKAWRGVFALGVAHEANKNSNAFPTDARHIIDGRFDQAIKRLDSRVGAHLISWLTQRPIIKGCLGTRHPISQLMMDGY